MRVLVGIDDTDNKDSRGTGYNSRQLAAAIESNNLGKVKGITRHQLFVHSDIPYTSQNSSACLDVNTDRLDDLKLFAREFMTNIGAIGSDVGLCILQWELVPDQVLNWGISAKSKVLTMKDAYELSSVHNIFLEGLTGTKDGIIGSLAAVGLRKGGNDGRFIWINSDKNLRDIEEFIHTIEVLKTYAGIDIVQFVDKQINIPGERVYLNGWARPILKDGKSVLLVDNEINNNDYEWKCSTKEFVKRVSN